MAHAEVRGQARQRQERRAALAERDRRLTVRQRRQLAEAIHPGRARPERVLGDRALDALEVVAHREHLAALLAHGLGAGGVVVVTADRALDMGDEAHGDLSRSWNAAPVYPIPGVDS